jgi:hypothetical protein
LNYGKERHFYSQLFKREFTFTIDENMKPAKPTGAIARKIEEANDHLSKIKNLDEILKRYSSPE